MTIEQEQEMAFAMLVEGLAVAVVHTDFPMERALGTPVDMIAGIPVHVSAWAPRETITIIAKHDAPQEEIERFRQRVTGA